MATLVCGCGDDASKDAKLASVEVKLADGGFAASTPKTFHVPPEAVVLVNVKTDRDGPYRLSVLSRSTAQTFKIASNDELEITLAGLKANETAQLILGKAKVPITADADE